jgi:hypothetical protein
MSRVFVHPHPRHVDGRDAAAERPAREQRHSEQRERVRESLLRCPERPAADDRER